MARRVLKNFLIALDQTLNTLIKLSDGFGEPDEMISARAHRLRKEHPWLPKLIDGIFFWDKDHCLECYIIELQRKQLPYYYRNKNSNAKIQRN